MDELLSKTFKTQLMGNTYLLLMDSNTCGKAFCDDACFKFFYLRLVNSLNAYQTKLHAYVLLESRILLLVTPYASRASESLISHLSGAYNEYFNLRFARSTRVLKKSFRRLLIEEQKDVLDAQKYLERLPVELNKASHLGEYKWSSYCSNSLLSNSDHLTASAGFKNFRKRQRDPFLNYRKFISTAFRNGFDNFLNDWIELPINSTGNKFNRQSIRQ